MDGVNGHELKQTPGESEGQGSLACCSPWGHKESDLTERLNSNNFSALRLLHGPLSDLYTTPGKTIALTIRTLGSKVMSLLFNMLSRFVITFLPRSKRLLISWLQSPSVVIWEPQKIKSVTISTFS